MMDVSWRFWTMTSPSLVWCCFHQEIDTNYKRVDVMDYDKSLSCL